MDEFKGATKEQIISINNRLCTIEHKLETSKMLSHDEYKELWDEIEDIREVIQTLPQSFRQEINKLSSHITDKISQINTDIHNEKINSLYEENKAKDDIILKMTQEREEEKLQRVKDRKAIIISVITAIILFFVNIILQNYRIFLGI